MSWTGYHDGVPVLVAEEYWIVTRHPGLGPRLEQTFLVRVQVEGVPPIKVELTIGNERVGELEGTSGGQLAVAMTAVRALPTSSPRRPASSPRRCSGRTAGDSRSRGWGRDPHRGEVQREARLVGPLDGARPRVHRGDPRRARQPVVRLVAQRRRSARVGAGQAFDDDGAEPHVTSDHFRAAIEQLPQALTETPRIINTTIEGTREWSRMAEMQVD